MSLLFPREVVRWGMTGSLAMLVACSSVLESEDTESIPLEEQSPAALEVPLHSVAAGGATSCASSASGRIFCWGLNAGPIRVDPRRERTVPVELPSAPTAVRLTMGEAGRFFQAPIGTPVSSSHVCGLTDAGGAFCWGSNGEARVGSGIDPMCSPDGGCSNVMHGIFPVAGGLSYRWLSAGRSDTCGIEVDGLIYCWGVRYSSTFAGEPRLLASALPPMRAVSVGWVASCALSEAGDTWCWGQNRYAQLGRPLTGDFGSTFPPEVVVDTIRFEQVSVGGGHVCALDPEGRAFCWGRNDEGQLGTGEANPMCPGEPISLNVIVCPDDPMGPRPVMSALRFKQLDTGLSHTCAIGEDDRAYCWGRGDEGQLGSGTPVGRSSPALVEGGERYASISAGTFHACALSIGGRAYCWGLGDSGQVGHGERANALSPALVLGQR